MIAHGFTVLMLKRSILTEKVSRRGYHLSREYAIDPLEIVFVREVVRTGVVALPADATPDRLDTSVMLRPREGAPGREQRLFPIVDGAQRLIGVVTRKNLREWIDTPAATRPPLADLMRRPVLAHADEPLRAVVYRMAETGLTRLPVVGADGRLIGMVALTDLLTARSRTLEADSRRERVFGSRLRLPWSFSGRAA
jgi:chloride channel protein, CIC family